MDDEGVQWVRKVPTHPSSIQGADPNQMTGSTRREDTLVQAVMALRKVFKKSRRKGRYSDL